MVINYDCRGAIRLANRESLKEIAYRYIKKNIISQNFECGYPILEKEIASKLNISRTPIREALKALEAEGFVKNYPFQSTIVSSLSQSDVEEICDLRLLLECWALKNSIHRITDEELDQVEAMFPEDVSKGYDWNTHHSADRALHGLIIRRANSPRLINMLNAFDDQIEWFRTDCDNEAERRASYREHIEIINAIRSRDANNADQALRCHLEQVKARFLKNVRFNVRK